MALTMAEKSVTSFLFKRLPFNLLQTFKLSTTQNPKSSSTTATTETSESSTESTRKKKKKSKNLFEVAKVLPNWGIGYHMAKKHWTNVSYEITKINLYKSGNHGKAWGLAYVNGLPALAPKKISGVHKRCWKYIKNPLKLEAPKPDESIPDPLKLEAQPAAPQEA
ncbi:uncharacterized protein LOC141616952 [Silene latifolia]|uniref:uncharacterized protein LOC141616952 n=1 Tax=Silene latifolia TaxID=37657 RepID=UPI003D76EB8F